MPTPVVDYLKDDSDMTMHGHTEADLGATLDSRYLKLNQSSAQTVTASPVFDWLTASKVVFTDSNKKLTSTGIGTSSQFIKGDGSLDSSTYLTSLTGALLSANNLSDVSNVATARTNLGLVSGGTGDIWVEKAGDTMTGQLFIDGSSDQIQLKVQAHTSQNNSTSPLIQLLNNAGLEILRLHTDDFTNIFFGYQAGLSNTVTGVAQEGQQNLFFGFQAGKVNTTGFLNVALGAQALYSNTSGSNNFAIGSTSLISNTTGYGNVAIGSQTMYLNTKGHTCVAIGSNALASNVTGWGNIALGAQALYSTTGSNNIAVGYDAGSNITSGIGNIIIGNNINLAYPAGNYQLNIGNALFGYPLDGSDDTMSTTRFGIGIALPLARFHIVGCADDEQLIVQGNSSQTKNLTEWQNSSGTVLACVSSAGNVGIGTTSPSGGLHINGTADDQQLIVEAHSTQTNNIVEIHDSSSNVLAYISPSGGALFKDKVIFTQTDGNEYIDSLTDGYMDYRATTAHRFGDGTNQLVIDADGDLSLEGTAKYERHVQIDAKADGTVANQPTSEDFFTAGGLQFASAGAQYSYCQWEIPDDWDGTDIVFEIDWFPDSGATTGTDAVRWTVEYRSIAEGELINQGTSVTVDNGVGGDTADYAQYETKHSRFTLDFDNANQPLTNQDHVYFKISRDTSVANDFAGTVTVSAYEIIYQSKGFPSSN